MKRGPNFQFMYIPMPSVDHTNEDDTVKTITWIFRMFVDKLLKHLEIC